MVEKEVLKKIFFLQDLPDPMLEKIAAITEIETFEKDTILFQRDQKLNLLYMLVSGKVLLKINTASGKSLTLDKVTAGRTFGIASLMKESSSSFSATCGETCSIISISGEEIHKLFSEDFKMGHKLMLQVVKLFKSRMERHTSQFLHSLSTHPEIKQLQET